MYGGFFLSPWNCKYCWISVCASLTITQTRTVEFIKSIKTLRWMPPLKMFQILSRGFTLSIAFLSFFTNISTCQLCLYSNWHCHSNRIIYFFLFWYELCGDFSKALEQNCNVTTGSALHLSIIFWLICHQSTSFSDFLIRNKSKQGESTVAVEVMWRHARHHHQQPGKSVKMNLCFRSGIRDCLDLFGTPMALCYSYICSDGVQSQRWKLSCCRPRFVYDSELGHFTLLFCRGRQRNVQRFVKHVHSYCLRLIKPFCLVTSSLPSSSGFAYAPPQR